MLPSYRNQETNQLIYRADQLTGFYRMGTLANISILYPLKVFGFLIFLGDINGKIDSKWVNKIQFVQKMKKCKLVSGFSFFLLSIYLSIYLYVPDSLHKKMKFSIKDFFSKCYQILSILWIRSHLLKKSLMENFIFCAVTPRNYASHYTWA